jgi:hypothetical protein
VKKNTAKGKTTYAAGLVALSFSFGRLQQGGKGEAALDLGRSNFGEDSTQE